MGEQINIEFLKDNRPFAANHSTPPPRVLLIADHSDDQSLPQIMTLIDEMPFELEQVKGIERSFVPLAESEPDMVLLSLSQLGEQSFDTFLEIYNRAGGVPVVLLISQEAKDLALKAVEQGAENYLVREQLDSQELARAIWHAARFNRMRQELNKRTQELKLSDHCLRDIITRDADGIIIIDRTGLVNYANPAAEALFERAGENFIGEPFGYPLVNGETVEIDIVYPPDLSTLAEMRVMEIIWEGKPAYLASFRNITERQQVEKMLYQYTQELEKHNEELDSFAHTVAHDLQGPLSTIIGFANALAEYHSTMNADELGEYLRAVARSAHVMSNIVEELLVLAGVRKSEVKLRTLDMADIMARVQQRLEDMIAHNSVELVVPVTWPAALGYGPWIEEVWVNYISNAIKYGGQPPRIELGAVNGTENTVRFWVRDNGIGVAPDDQERLFKPFTQLNQVRATGHGLGLSIVRRIVERLGGRVWVDSEGVPGQGSTFNFTLPQAPTS